MKLRLTAPCRFGLEKTLSFEIKRAGGENLEISDGRINFDGDETVLVRCNLTLSVAERVGIVLGEFTATTFDELFEQVKALPVEQFVGKFDRFPVKGHSLNSVLKSEPACQKIIKKALVERLKSVYGIGYFQETEALYQFVFSIMKNKVTVTLDTTGDGLHKRGYRKLSNAAPIRETLAAGIVDLARVRDNDVICDPFCGSGTLLIESALKALNIAPGLNRTFSAEEWECIPKQLWQDERERARAAIKTDCGFTAYGFDIDEEAVQLTLHNAKEAGVADRIHVEKRDIKDFTYPENVTCVLTNPPYGERLLEQEQARELYKALGKALLPLDGRRAYVITPDAEFETMFGQKAGKNRKLYNGMLMCRLYSYY
ncbi:MAG: class I SAM-dependent RNA methyltransferase [Eubacterium sp.]|nr:class I SAM-dependent RNA methyltransferase [Eubacterium sp.]